MEFLNPSVATICNAELMRQIQLRRLDLARPNRLMCPRDLFRPGREIPFLIKSIDHGTSS